MAIEISTQGGVQVLRVEGDFTGSNAAQLREAAELLLQRDEHDYVVDVSLVQAIDSTGLEALTWLQRCSEERLGGVRVASANSTIDTILQMTRLSQKIECHPNVDAAVAGFG